MLELLAFQGTNVQQMKYTKPRFRQASFEAPEVTVCSMSAVKVTRLRYIQAYGLLLCRLLLLLLLLLLLQKYLFGVALSHEVAAIPLYKNNNQFS